MNLSEVVNDHWSKPLVDSMLTTNTYVGKYMKQALIEYMQFITYELKNIDMFISDISKTILIPENLNMELQLCLLNEDVRKKYVLKMSQLREMLVTLKQITSDYQIRHNSEYAHDDHMKRSLFIDNRRYVDDDVLTHKIYKDIFIPHVSKSLSIFIKNIDSHILKAKREKNIQPFRDAYEVLDGNYRPHLIRFIIEITEMYNILKKDNKI